jgi:hypothetical protein
MDVKGDKLIKEIQSILCVQFASLIKSVRLLTLASKAVI